jgi:hypothetical protein
MAPSQAKVIWRIRSPEGMLYHDESTVFGEALKAHILDSQIVRFPRIMITRNQAGG